MTEVILILYYYLTWDKWTGDRKKAHIRLGFNLTLFSWITMVIIVAILAFMMAPGSWHQSKIFLSGFLKPIYLPQLAFRTPLAMVMAGGAAYWVLCFVKVDDELRSKATAFIGKWILGWLPFLLLGSWIYYQVIPDAMKAHMGVAITTQEYISWYKSTLYTIFGALGAVAVIAMSAIAFKKLPKPVMILPFIFLIGLMGMFERSREFIRKPFAIGGYLYANGIRKDDYPLLQKEGILTHAPYVSVREITPENTIAAGRELFTLTCTRCHTVTGVNSVTDRFKVMYGAEKWEPQKISDYIAVMHQARTFMPPFPGNEKERFALAAYITSLQNKPEKLEGVQSHGIEFNAKDESKAPASVQEVNQ